MFYICEGKSVNKSAITMIIMGILLIGVSAFILVSNFQYFILGNTTDLNELVSDNRLNDEAISQTVTLKVNRCLGNCAEYSSFKHGNYEYYIVMLDDNSVMLIEISPSKTEEIKLLDSITQDTLDSKGKESSYHSVSYTGGIHNISNKKIKRLYNETIESMKEQKIIAKDVVVRDMVIHGGGERFWGIIAVVGLFIVGAFLAVIGIVAAKGE